MSMPATNARAIARTSEGLYDLGLPLWVRRRSYPACDKTASLLKAIPVGPDVSLCVGCAWRSGPSDG
jgi:hypothetical protein